MQYNKSQTIQLASIIGFGVLGGAVIFWAGAQPVPVDTTPVKAMHDVQPPAAPAKAPTTTKKVSPPPAAANLTYQQTVDQYAGRRIQFNACTPNPSSMTVKGGTAIMLDNRSAETADVRLDGVSYKITGYGYKIATLKKVTAQQSVKVDCVTGSTQRFNAARILVQP